MIDKTILYIVIRDFQIGIIEKLVVNLLICDGTRYKRALALLII